MANEQTPENAPDDMDSPAANPATPDASAGPSVAAESPAAPDAKPAAVLLSRVFSGSSSSAAILGIVLFFLPWQRWSCRDVTIVSQSGYELTTGRVTKNENWERELDDALKRDFRPETTDATEPRERKRQLDRGRSGLDKMDGNVGVFFCLILYLVGMIVVAGSGWIGIFARRPVSTLPAFLGAMLVLLAVAGCLTSDFPIEKGIVHSDEPGLKVIDELMYLERTPFHSAAMTTGFVVLSLVIVQTLIVTVVQRSPESQAAVPG